MRVPFVAMGTVAFLLLAGPAGAATICVGGHPGPGCDESHAGLQAALTSADANGAGLDTVLVRAPTDTGPYVADASNPVTIVGSGPAASVLLSLAAGAVLQLDHADSSVSDLHLQIRDTGAFDGPGLDLGAGADATRVTVTAAAPNPADLGNISAVILRGASTLSDSTVTVPVANANRAVSMDGNGNLVQNVTLTGRSMVSLSSGTSGSIARMRSGAPSIIGIDSRGGSGTVEVTDSLILLANDPNATGIESQDFLSTVASPTLIARHLTIVGQGQGLGAWAEASNAGSSSLVDLRDSVISNVATDLRAEATVAGAAARIDVNHSNFDPAKVQTLGPGSAQVVQGAANVLGDPGFVNAAALDFHLGPTSGLVDRGFPGAGSSADLDGLPRPGDGNGDGAAVRDIGAYEYQRPALVPPALDMQAPVFSIASRRLKLDRNRRVTIVLRAPTNESANSTGSYVLRTARRVRLRSGVRRRLTLGRARLVLAPNGSRVKVRLRLSRRNANTVRRLVQVRVVLAVTLRDGSGNTATKRKRLVLTAVLSPRV